MADFILLNEDFSDFPIGEFPYDKNHSAMGEYHFIHYPGYYGKWYEIAKKIWLYRGECYLFFVSLFTFGNL